MTHSDLEKRIQATGAHLFELIKDEKPSVFQSKYWMGKIMDWSMKDEAFKVEMFRFVDVFPYLDRPELVAAHLREYFCRPNQDFPAALQWGIKSLAPTSLGAKMISKTIGQNINAMGRQFIAGADPQDALPALEELRSKNMTFTVDLLGEAVISTAEEEFYLQRYLDLFDALNAAQRAWPAIGNSSNDLDWGYSPRINVSLKPSSLYSQMNARAFEHSVAAAKERLRPILRKAVAANAFLLLDMEHTALKNLTLALYCSIMEEAEFAGYPYTGLALQTYLKDCEADALALIQWVKKRKQPMTIRVVKGAYWDAEVIWARQNNWPAPVFTDKHETDASFEKITRLLLENTDLIQVACASHNIRSIAFAMESAKALNASPERVEYQILYGMGEPVRNALSKAGLPLRIYTPVGAMIPGMAYLVRRLLENTSNESFLRQRFFEGASVSALLENPLNRLQSPSKEALKSKKTAGGISAFQNEPLIDWTIAQNRKNFTDALNQVRNQPPYHFPLFIDGKKVETSSLIASFNPNDPDHKVGEVCGAGTEEARQAVEAAVRAFESWRDVPEKERAEYLFKAASVTRKRRYELAALQVCEVGKTWSEADADVCEAIDFLEYYGREMLRLSMPQKMGRTPGEISHLVYEPRGVGVVIAPWNFPLAISMGMTSAAIVAGNTVAYKPSSDSPITGAMMYEIFESVGLPPGVLNYLPGPGDRIGDYLVTHPDVSFIAFTGSTEVGLKIAELSSRTSENALGIKRVIAEMGGKNAIIVDADADLDEALVQILRSAFGYQGQKCSACSRLIVLEPIYDRLIKRLKEAAQSIILGNAESPETFMGAVINPNAVKKIGKYIEIGKAEGRVLLERSFPDSRALGEVPLVIFTDILDHHRLAKEEIFGPVLSVMKAKDFDQALKIANSTRHALTGSVFSRSPENIAKAKKSFRVGNLYINRGCTGALVQRHPFGGFKMSGIGSKTGGPDYLLQFMAPRNIVENTMRRGFAPELE